MRNLRNQNDYWKQCRPGSIFGVTDSKFRRERRKFAVRVAMGGVVAVVTAFSSLFLLSDRKGKTDFEVADLSTTKPHPRHSRPKRLSCALVVDLMPQYIKAIRKESELRDDKEKELVAGYDQHLQYCVKCRPKVLAAVNNQA